ncbi:SurA N-terminal domain-containing protein, partial [Francisella tularensis]
MKKLITIFLLMLMLNNAYSDISSSMFQNAFNSGIDATSPVSMNVSDKKYLVNKTVAIVNSRPITSFELDQELAKLEAMQPNSAFNTDPLKLKRQALQDLISQSVLLQLAERNNIMISNQQLDSAIQDIAAKNGVSVESLKLNVEAAGMSFDSYKKRIRDQLMISQLQQQAIAQQVYVSPEEIQKYIKKHQKEFDREMSPVKLYTLKNLIVALPDSKKARQKKIDLFKKLALAVNNGSIDFSEIVKQFSQAPNAVSGGIVSQQVKFDSIPDIYKEYIKELKNHQVSQPFIVNHTLQMIYIDNI